MPDCGINLPNPSSYRIGPSLGTRKLPNFRLFFRKNTHSSSSFGCGNGRARGLHYRPLYKPRCCGAPFGRAASDVLCEPRCFGTGTAFVRAASNVFCQPRGFGAAFGRAASNGMHLGCIVRTALVWCPFRACGFGCTLRTARAALVPLLGVRLPMYCANRAVLVTLLGVRPQMACI